MSKSNLIRGLSVAAVCAGLAACAGPQPVPYSGIGSVAYLKPNPNNNSGKVPYIYSTRTNWASYSNVMIDPVIIYQGVDQQFGNMSDSDRAKLAQYMQETFADALSQRFNVVSKPGPDTLRIKLTLTGAAKTNFIGQFAHIDMGGNVYNGVQSIRGGQGLESGWVMYTVEISDAASGQLLEAYETKQYPNALNIHAAFGSLAAAKIGIDKGADMLAAGLE